MKYHLCLFSFLIFLLHNPLHAQVTPLIEWQKCLGGSENDEAYSIEQTSDSGYIVAGYSFSNDGDISANYGGLDGWIAKLNADGNFTLAESPEGNSAELKGNCQTTK